MTEYQLFYLPLRGRAECIRYILHQGGAKFKDIRLSEEEWATLKPNSLMGQLPILKFDNFEFCQSRTIQRYLARELGLSGKNKIEEALADMYVDGVNDLTEDHRTVVVPLIHEKGNKEKSQAAWVVYRGGSLKRLMDRYEAFMVKNGTGWLVGNDVTWADLVVTELLDKYHLAFDSDLMNAHPQLAALTKRVHELPRIKQYTSTRPTTNFGL